VVKATHHDECATFINEGGWHQLTKDGGEDVAGYEGGVGLEDDTLNSDWDVLLALKLDNPIFISCRQYPPSINV
jgi:hypothetical protein